MGHESLIEPWSPLERRSALLVSELNRRRRQHAMTTASRENPNLWAHAQEPSEWCGGSKHILLTQRGWKARKFPAMGKVFFLDFPFYRTEVTRDRRKFRIEKFYGKFCE